MVESMFVIEHRGHTHTSFVFSDQEQIPGRVDQNVVRELVTDMEQGQRGKRVGSILYTPEYGQIELGNYCVAEFMGEDE